MTLLSTLILLALLSTSKPAASCDIPGLERLRWGMTLPEARQAKVGSWLASGGGTAVVEAKVVGRAKTMLNLTFEKRHLVMVSAIFGMGDDDADDALETMDSFRAASRVLEAKLGPPKRYGPGCEVWKTATTLLVHQFRKDEDDTMHQLEATDRRGVPPGDDNPCDE